MKKLRLAIDAHHLEGQRTGVGRYLENILKAWLSRRDLAITLIFKDQIPGDDFLGEPIINNSLAPRVAGPSSTVLFQHLGLGRVLQKLQPDVFWGPGYLLPLFYKGSTLLTIHDIIYEARPEWYSWPSGWDRLFLRWAGRQSAKRAAKIVVPSEFTKSEIIKHYRLPAERLAVTPLAPDARFTPARHRDKAVFRRWHIGENYILFVGALIERRCIPMLIEAFQMIEYSRRDSQLVLVGPDYLKKKLKDLGNSQIVHVPFADTAELSQLYSFARVTVALSLYEGFGLPIIEAMACGSPVVASATASQPEVMGEAALAVKDPTDARELAEVLRRLLADQALAVELSQRSLQQARRFSWAKTAAATLEVIKEIHAQSF